MKMEAKPKAKLTTPHACECETHKVVLREPTSCIVRNPKPLQVGLPTGRGKETR